MIPGSFEYHRPSTVSEAVALLGGLDSEARVLAGGHSLIPMMKLRLAQPSHLIDLAGVGELKGVRVESGEVVIGAMTTQHEVIASEALAIHAPILREAAQQIADPQVRYLGTIGGNAANGDPGNDMPALLMTLDASYELRGPAGGRRVRAREYYLGIYETAAEPGEILTEIRVALQPRAGSYRRGSAYQKVGRRVGDWPVGAAGAALWLSDGVVAEAGIGLSAVGARHFSAVEAEDYLRGVPASAQTFARAGQLAAEHCRPSSDQRGPADYKRHLACELTIRALDLAWRRAQPADPGLS